MDTTRSEENANSFGRAAVDYERARPTYPIAAVDWLIPARAKTVLDLGAGTGKFTRSLVAKGLEVIAVEPDDVMRSTLSQALPAVRALAGRGESIPLEDDSVDAVTIAQAWHWMDHEVATKEIARVLRPGGTLGLVWNLRDESVEWVRKLDAVMGKSEAERYLDHQLTIGPPFGQLETFDTGWENELGVDDLVALVASRSYIITATEDERQKVFREVRELAASDPALAGREAFELPYRAFCFKAALPK